MREERDIYWREDGDGDRRFDDLCARDSTHKSKHELLCSQLQLLLAPLLCSTIFTSLCWPFYKSNFQSTTTIYFLRPRPASSISIIFVVWSVLAHFQHVRIFHLGRDLQCFPSHLANRSVSCWVLTVAHCHVFMSWPRHVSMSVVVACSPLNHIHAVE